MRPGLTAQQDRILHFIEESLAHSRIAPSYEAMAAHIGQVSSGNIHRIISCLEERGYVRRIPAKARSITLISQVESQVEQSLADATDSQLLAEIRKRGALFVTDEQ